MWGVDWSTTRGISLGFGPDFVVGLGVGSDQKKVMGGLWIGADFGFGLFKLRVQLVYMLITRTIYAII